MACALDKGDAEHEAPLLSIDVSVVVVVIVSQITTIGDRFVLSYRQVWASFVYWSIDNRSCLLLLDACSHHEDLGCFGVTPADECQSEFGFTTLKSLVQTATDSQTPSSKSKV